jgi:hypothetical protein
MYPSCLVIQENVISDRAEDWFSLEVLTSMSDVVLDIGIREGPFPFQAPARVVEPRGSSNEARYNQSHETQSNSTRWDDANA